MSSPANTDCPQSLLAGLDIYMVPDDWKGLLETQVAQVEEALATDADPVEAAALQAEVQAIEKEVAAVDELEQRGATAEAEKEARGIQEQITDIFSILSLGK